MRWLQKTGITVVLFLLFFYNPVIAPNNTVIKIFDPYHDAIRYDVYYSNGSAHADSPYFTNTSISLSVNDTYVFIPSRNYIDLSNPQEVYNYLGFFLGIGILIMIFLAVIIIFMKKRR